MYTVAALIVMAIALGGVTAILDSVLDLAGASETVRKLPLIGGHLYVAVAIRRRLLGSLLADDVFY